MHCSRSILNAFFVLALALVPVAQASIYAMADGVNSNALERIKAQKRAQNQQYKDLVRNPLRFFRRQETSPGGTPIPTPTDLPPILNISTTTTSPDTTTTDAESSSLTTLDTTSTDDNISTTASSTDAETTGPPETTDVSSTTEDITSTTDRPSDETTSTDLPAETSSDVPSSTEEETTRTTLDTTVKSAFTTAYSTSTFTLPNGAVSTRTEYLVVVPTISPPPKAPNPQESDTATGTASLHTNAAPLYTPGPAPMVALMAVLGYVGAAAF